MEKPNDETIKEILREDQFTKNNGKKSNNRLVRFLLFIVILIVIALGFIYVQQYLLDLEAEAIVSAARTATASVSMPIEKVVEDSQELSEESANLSVPTEPTITSTPDPALARTATISVQLTDVAEFQQSVTREP